MKIAYLLDTFPSASETFLAREIEALREDGLDIVVFALRAGEGAERIHSPARWQQSLSRAITGEARAWRATGEGLAPRLKSLGITHLHSGWASHPAYIAWGAAAAAGLPWSFSGHSRDIWVEGGDLGGKLAAAEWASACSESGAARLREFTPDPAKVFYAPHGLRPEQYPRRPWQPGEDWRLLGVGRLVEKKGWPDLLAALEILRAQERICTLHIVGDGPLRPALVAQARKAGFTNVTWLGSLPESGVIEAMRAADCLVLPSRIAADGDRDGLANVLLEGAALGVPLVTTSAGAARDFVDESTGLIVPEKSPVELAAAIAGIFENPVATMGRCASARRRVVEQFDLIRNVEPLAARFRA